MMEKKDPAATPTGEDSEKEVEGRRLSGPGDGYSEELVRLKSDRREAESKLREREQEYRAIAETQTEFIVRWKPDGTRLFVNDAYCRHFKTPREKLIGTSFFPLLSDDYRETFMEKIASLTPENPTATGVEKIRIPDGTIGLQEWTDIALYDSENNLIGYQSVGRDITGRKRAEVELRRSEARYRDLVGNSPLCIHELDLDGRFLSMNGVGLSMIGESDEEAVRGRDCLEMVTEEDRDRVAALLKLAIAGRGSRFEFNTPEATGERCFSSCFVPLRSEAGEVVRLMGITEDITERRNAERKLESAFAEIRTLKERLEAENVYLREEIRTSCVHGDIVGSSDALKAVLAQVEKVAETEASVLLFGETGTGKELLARAVHNVSLRSDKPFVIVNCAAIPPNLVESELFGRERGAYTGAHTKQVGRFEIANGGTLFLDEIGELPMDAQVKLLRVLQEGIIERLGSVKSIPVDVRIVAATNRDLGAMVEEGTFRADLFYRLNVFPIRVPPLRERADDISAIAWSFVEEFSEKMGKRINGIDRDSLNALREYSWPGNVRELRNTIERAMIRGDGRNLRIPVPSRSPGRRKAAGATVLRSLAEAEKEHIFAVLEHTGWKIRGKGGAAEILEMPPSTLESRMKKLAIERVK